MSSTQKCGNNFHQETLRAIEEAGGIKKVAAELGKSPSLLYKWCQESEQSGAPGPFERFIEFFEICPDKRMLEIICNMAGGYFCLNEAEEEVGSDEEYLSRTQSIVQEFSSLLEAMSSSYANDCMIDESEAKKIEREWIKLKSIGEQFINACKNGKYSK